MMFGKAEFYQEKECPMVERIPADLAPNLGLPKYARRIERINGKESVSESRYRVIGRKGPWVTLETLNKDERKRMQMEVHRDYVIFEEK